MNKGDIADSLFCLGAATAKDLPDIEYDRKMPQKGVPFHLLPVEKATRRPYHGDCPVYSFPQTWGHGSLGFGGMGTASFTTAQVTVVFSGQAIVAVYYGRQLAYVVTKADRQLIWDDMRKFNMADCDEAKKYGTIFAYGKSYIPRESV